MRNLQYYKLQCAYKQLDWWVIYAMLKLKRHSNPFAVIQFFFLSCQIQKVWLLYQA